MARQATVASVSCSFPSFLAVLLTVAACAAKAAADTSAVEKIFVFGDSLLDVGNLKFVPAKFVPNAYLAPYGRDYVPRSGRYCDGKLTVDYIADYLNLTSPPPAMNSTSNFSSGMNFAVAGATALTSHLVPAILPSLALPEQIKMFTESVRKMSRDDRVSLRSSLFILSISSNEIINHILLQISTPSSLAALALNPLLLFPTLDSEYVMSTLMATRNAIMALRALGARKTVVYGLGALGCTPLVRGILNIPECFQPLSDFVDQYNKMLLGMLKPFISRKEVLILNANKIIVNHGAKSINACCGGPAPINGRVQCADRSGNFTTCTDPASGLFWDFLHPTAAANKVIVNLAFKGNSITYPGSLSTFLDV